jgi:hypothetical protein
MHEPRSDGPSCYGFGWTKPTAAAADIYGYASRYWRYRADVTLCCLLDDAPTSDLSGSESGDGIHSFWHDLLKDSLCRIGWTCPNNSVSKGCFETFLWLELQPVHFLKIFSKILF